MPPSQRILRQSDTEESLPNGTERGTITLILGCMFSGKTTLLLQRLQGIRADSHLVFKHMIDRRYAEDAVVTHGGLATPAIAVSRSVEILSHLNSRISVVAIDEAHFFDASLIQTLEHLACRGVDTILTSLEPDSWGVPFPLVGRLRCMANEAIVQTATCAQCGAEANRTQRLTPIVNENMVGGAESYEPRCLSCWSPPP